MKHFILKILAAAALLAALPQARAWTYNDGDVLLIFRQSGQDIEFDIGSVTNFLGKTNGYTVTVPNWNVSLVNSTVGSVTGAKFVLVAAGAATNWLSSAEPNTTAYNVSQSAYDTLYGVLNAIGNKPLYPLPIPTNGANAYALDTGGQYKASSYDYVVSGGNYSGISKLGGNAPFTVEQSVPGFLDFWQISPSTVYPNPPADTLVGTFYITASGVLTFVAGPRPPAINSVTRSGNVSSIRFSTTIGNSYSLSFTNKLGGPISSWPVDTTTITGNGSPNTITHTNSAVAEFFKVRTQ